MEWPTLKEANAVRQLEWLGPLTHLPLSFRTNELAGETGEVAELMLDRWVPGTHMHMQWQNAVADELSDLVICSEIIAWQLGGIDLDYVRAEGLAHRVGNDYHWATMLMREVGLLCNLAKKNDRIEYGIAGGSVPERTVMTEKLNRIVSEAYCMAYDTGIIMEVAVARKFNQTSRKVGLQTLYIPPGHARDILIP